MSMAQAKQMDIYIKIQYLRRFYRYDKNTFRLPRQDMSNRLANPDFRGIMAVPFWNLPTFYQQPRANATIQNIFLLIISTHPHFKTTNYFYFLEIIVSYALMTINMIYIPLIHLHPRYLSFFCQTPYLLS